MPKIRGCVVSRSASRTRLPTFARQSKADEETGGLIITQLRREGIGAVAGLLVGDLITQAGSKRRTNVAEIASVDRPTPKLPLLLRVVRDGSARFIAVSGGDEP